MDFLFPGAACNIPDDKNSGVNLFGILQIPLLNLFWGEFEIGQSAFNLILYSYSRDRLRGTGVSFARPTGRIGEFAFCGASGGHPASRNAGA